MDIRNRFAASVIGALALLVIAPMGSAQVGRGTAPRTVTWNCSGCHGVDGNAQMRQFPRLAGLDASYIEERIATFQAAPAPPSAELLYWLVKPTAAKKVAAGSTPEARADMVGIAHAITPQEAKAAAAWYSTQKPVPGHSANPALDRERQSAVREWFPGKGCGRMPGLPWRTRTGSGPLHASAARTSVTWSTSCGAFAPEIARTHRHELQRHVIRQRADPRPRGFFGVAIKKKPLGFTLPCRRRKTRASMRHGSSMSLMQSTTEKRDEGSCAARVWSTRPGRSLIGTNWREFGLIPQAAALLFAWSVAGNPETPRVFLRGVAISGAIAGAYGIAQYFGWDPLLPASAYHIGEGIWSIVRPPGTLGYVSYFATWLVVSVYLSLALETMETTAVLRGIARAAAAICAVAMVLTGTRAALLGLAAGGAMWLYLRGFRVTRRMAAGAAAVTLLAAAFYFSPAGWNLRSRARWFGEDRSGGGRVLLWRDTVRMASHRLAAGYGPEVYTAEFARFESPELAAAYPDFEWESPHNMFLDALASQGILGLAALVALCAAGFVAAFRKPTAESASMAAALTAGIVSQQFTVSTIPTAVIIYTTVGLLARETCFGSLPLGKLKHALPSMALGLIYCAVRLTVADAALARTQRALTAGDETTAAAQYGRYQHWRFPGSSADLWYSRASLQLSQNTQQPSLRLQTLCRLRRRHRRLPQRREIHPRRGTTFGIRCDE